MSTAARSVLAAAGVGSVAAGIRSVVVATSMIVGEAAVVSSAVDSTGKSLGSI